jgi:hypothetical protein
MKPTYERLIREVVRERSRLISRRRFLAGGAGLAAAASLGIAAREGVGTSTAFAQNGEPFADDVDFLNYALVVEHLEHAFYRDGLGRFALGVDGYGVNISNRLAAIRRHEQAHVELLTQVILGFGGEPVAEASYDFGYTDSASFLMTAAALENVGVMAYDGAGQYVNDSGLLTTAGSIVAVEARHAAYLNLITGAEPIPSSFEEAKPPDEILELTSNYIASA